MNILIVGCGNVGFETAKLLCGENTLLLVDIVRPGHMETFLGTERNVSFVAADATNAKAMETVVDDFVNIHRRIDVLVCTVGAYGPATPVDDVEAFVKNFELNVFGNLVPVKSVAGRMALEGSGTIILMSSTSGHYSPKILTAYAPSKWALGSLCSSLRRRLTPAGITLDVLCPTTLRNKYSRTFRNRVEDVGPGSIAVEDIASRIADIVYRPKNTDHFIPSHYAVLRHLETSAPGFLDQRCGLLPWRIRKSRYSGMAINDVLVTGASTALGRELAYSYANSAKRLCLTARDQGALVSLEKDISACKVETACIDIAERESVKKYVAGIGNVDLVINCPETRATVPQNGIDADAYRQSFSDHFYSIAYLVALLSKNDSPPDKVVNILPLAETDSCHTDEPARAALYAYTRSLRRVCGNNMQVIEVLVSPSFSSSREIASMIHAGEQSGKEILNVQMPLARRIETWVRR